MYPFRFLPVYQNYVWGGVRIPKVFHRPMPKGDRFAESWEISDRKEGMSILENGPWKGKTLHTLLQEMKESLVGEGRPFSQFPLLVKIIDAKENLSIQVHPDEKTAVKFHGEPKTEMWLALEESLVFAGLKKGVSQKGFEEAISQKNAEKLLHPVDLKKGEALFIPSGRVHAIQGGSLIYEVQQNSNTTYRLYDWGREGRELHLKEGFASVNWGDFEPNPRKPKTIQKDENLLLESLVECPFFSVERALIQKSWKVPTNRKTFQIFFCKSGQGLIYAEGHKEVFSLGMTYLIPAFSEGIEILGNCEVIRIFLQKNS